MHLKSHNSHIKISAFFSVLILLPFLLSFFNKQFPTVNFLDPGQEIADKVRKTVKKPSKRNSMKIFTSSKPEKFQKDLSKIGIKQKVTFLN